MPDIKAFYGTPFDAVITLAGLASDANLLAGRQSVEIDNTVLRAVDFTIGGRVTAGANATGGVIELWVVASLDNLGLYPDTVTNGGDLARTFSSANAKNFNARLIGNQPVTASASALPYWFAPMSVTSLFVSQMAPPRFVVFGVHSTGVAINSSQIRIQPEYETIG
jgi:hypothetical protein